MGFDLRLNDLKSFDVVGFGITTLDHVCLVDRIASYQKQANINNIKFFGGGCVSTALIVVQRMGAQTSLITSIGDDWIGREVLKGLKEENIDCRAVTCIKDMMSSFSFVQVNKKLGKRAIAYFPGAGGLLKFTDSAARIIKKGKILLLDSLSPGENLKAARYAHENSILI
ncbi:MAG: carbohydrate kinase family protein, partial [Actinobacteria bacterium]|nr:carbohydrate kinase family protein [Actinomycetota bacterium]